MRKFYSPIGLRNDIRNPIFLLAFLLLVNEGFILTEDFEDEDLTRNPAWSGDLEDFLIVEEDHNHLLRLEGKTDGGISQLTTPVSLTFGSWEFYIRFDGFDPSNNNRAYIFLTTDSDDLEGAVNGYALRTGENGQPKHFRLMRFDQGVETEILSAQTHLSAGSYRVRATRTAAGEWSLYVAESPDSIPVIDSETVTDLTHAESSFFGLRFHYTSTRRNRFFIDDIVIRDQPEPTQVAGVRPLSETRIEVTFSDRINVADIHPENFIIDGSLIPLSAEPAQDHIVHLEFENTLADGEYKLQVINIRDRNGNLTDQDSRFLFRVANPFSLLEVRSSAYHNVYLHFTETLSVETTPNDFIIEESGIRPVKLDFKLDSTVIRLEFADSLEAGKYRIQTQNLRSKSGWTLTDSSPSAFYIFDAARAGDIIINEFMYRPPENLPEYVEIYNTGNRLLNLQHWQLKDNTAAERLISSDVLPIYPHSYLVISHDTLALQTVFGSQSCIQMSGFPSFNRSAQDFIRLYDHHENLMDSLAYFPPEWGGFEKSLERKSPDAPSATPYNWKESDHPLGGTPGFRNSASPDSIAPKMIKVVNQGDKILHLVFDRKVTDESARELAAYSISHDRSPAHAARIQAEIIELELDHPLKRGFKYSINADGIENIFGFSQAQSRDFYFVESSDSGDVFINEFMYNPPPGSSRYIELYNPGEKAVDLADWTVNNNTGNRSFITRSRNVLPPDSYVVLAPDDNLTSDFPALPLINMGSRFQALKLNGDDLVIRNANGMVMDSLTYDPGWGGSGVSLERKSTGLPAGLRDNWGDSPAGFGTPGRKNAIRPDSIPPAIENIRATSERGLKIRFSVTPEPGTALNLNNYSISPPKAILAASQFGAEVNLLLAGSLESEKKYTLIAQGIEDIFGNRLIKQKTDFRWIRFHQAEERDVVINEILYRPSPSGPDRYIEIYNRSEHVFNLEGWRVGRGTGSPAVISAGSVYGDQPGKVPLLPGHRLVLTADTSRLPHGDYHAVELSGFPAFSRLGDSVYLLDEHDNRIDSLRYKPEWGGNLDGKALQRINPDGASNDPANWTGSYTISPGERNAVFQPDTLLPRMIYASVSDNEILVRFNKFIRINPTTRFLIDQKPLAISGFDPFSANTLTLHFEENNPDNMENQVVTADDLIDYAGNENRSDNIPLSWPMRPGNVVINEIMHQPFADRYSDRPPQSQYIELLNRAGHAVSLEGFYIHDRPDRDNQVIEIHPENTLAAWLPPGGYAVLYPDTSVSFSKSRISRAFAIDQDSRFYRVNRNTLSLPVSDGEVYLSGPGGLVIDSVYYRSKWPNPNLIDTRGLSLERINPDLSSTVASNWSSSAHPDGGTPGMKNSIFAQSESAGMQSGIHAEPNPFSPDGSGYEDHLLINYMLDQPDYLMRVRIFDRFGRLITTLADGEAAGRRGQLIWDGRRDDQSENRIGIYIILFEAYDSTGGRSRTYRETVVLARRL